MRHGVRATAIVGDPGAAPLDAIVSAAAQAARGDDLLVLVSRLVGEGRPTGNRQARRRGAMLLRRRARGAAEEPKP